MRTVPAILAAFVVFLAHTVPAYAEDPVDMSRRVIEEQIKAFLQDDADRAYSFAAPAIKAKFPDKDVFFAMVKKSYAPVYHPGNYAFGRNRLMADGAVVVHELMISGKDGKNWKAMYKLARQPDGAYKIDGVVIMPDLVSKGI
ncbi:MAG: hypothetical protein JWM58_2836 [Rhizobium sp.]|nr:hypothetical protein [Rhizobium sp.]